MKNVLRCLAAGLVLALTAGGAYAFAFSVAREDPAFTKPRLYRTAELLGYRLHPDAVAVGDLNTDGKRDLVTAGTNVDGEVSGVVVFLNRGDGSFQTARAYRTAWDPSAVAVGDVNGDGKPDLASANADDVSVLINRGDGRFLKSVQYAARQPRDIAIGDLNGDSAPDLVTANSKLYVNSISVYVNRGDGSFENRVDYRTGRVPVSVAIADLNADGKPDVATASLTNTLSVLINRGDGTFLPRVEYRTALHPRSLAIGDMNGDRRPDLVTASTGGPAAPGRDRVSVLLNKGDGTFQPRRDYRAKGQSTFGPVAIGDLTGDGKQDVAVGQDLGDGDEPRRITVLVGRGDGTFTRRLDYPTGPSIADAWAPRGIAVGYLDGDGRLDLVAAKWSGVSVLLNRTRR